MILLVTLPIVKLIHVESRIFKTSGLILFVLCGPFLEYISLPYGLYAFFGSSWHPFSDLFIHCLPGQSLRCLDVMDFHFLHTLLFICLGQVKLDCKTDIIAAQIRVLFR